MILTRYRGGNQLACTTRCVFRRTWRCPARSEREAGIVRSVPIYGCLSVERIEQKILLIRDQKVMLDRDLAELYGVRAIALRQQVSRNKERFPDDFMFQLSAGEAEAMVSQNVIPSKRSLGGSLPYAFTQEGVAMLSSVLRSQRAVEVNIQIMRAFVKLREFLTTHKDLARKIKDIEKKYDQQLQVVFDAIRKLIEQPSTPKKRKIGFLREDSNES